ncbi:MAG: hypothetical protein US96_C0003G0015 [Candidatus Woesebacteria bacterium GW2011_GWB1_38_5b]|uniref:LytR/CpsA/Psr regulator C-terminal domain-containing protein n=1 Tax=Candidatus Woesebacteria bacterium GW2011_GWB1_38_5b TaxID=1618569 RepID=A0A0G0KAH8_9BACT|nr:MAG: hypothetical protein US96_C0003G0015 [Candidatus Woesebacteria bacterium GW2011_GWB1_38_5b]
MRKRPARNKTSLPKIRSGWFLIVILIIFCLFGWALWELLPQSWDTRSRLTVATKDSQQTIYIAIFDPQTHSLIKIIIPGNTLIDTANGLGKWQLSSIVKLGQNEGLGLTLLAQSITKGLKLPIDAVAEERALALSDPNIFNILKSAFSDYETNLTLKDKINLGLFSLRAKNTDRTTLNLEDTGMLKKSTLPGGDEGYVPTGNIPPALAAHFSDPMFENSFRITVIDSSGEGLSNQISQILESLGGKVFSVQNKEMSDTDCLIVGEKKPVVQRIAGIFSCAIDFKKTESSFDIEIYLGTQFAKRF